MRSLCWMLAGAVAAMALVTGCEDGETATVTPPAAAEETAADAHMTDVTSTILPENPVITVTAATYDKEIFLWKIPSDEAGAIVRWPTAFYRQLGVTGDNSFVMVNGQVRMDFYKIDEDIGAKISYRNREMRTSSLPFDCPVILFKDGRKFAGMIVPNPDERYETTLQPFTP
jgi:hypothetical protein